MADEKLSELTVAPGALLATDYMYLIRGDGNSPEVFSGYKALLDTLLGGTPATNTEQLTGTSAVKSSTPDSVAALWEAGADITDGATITIGEGAYFNLITSTTAITAFTITTNKAGRTFRVRFNTARTLTHHATSLILPTGGNIPTEVGDIAQFRSLGSGNVVCEWYTRASGVPLTGGGVSATQTDFISGIIAAPADQDYRIALNLPYALTITKITTRCLSGTITLTGKINTTALGGTANSVSSSEQSQTHASANVASVGDDIVLTLSSNSSCVDLSFLIEFTRTLA